MKTTSSLLGLFLLLALSLVPKSASADTVLYDNGPDSLAESRTITGFSVSDSFNLVSSATLTSFQLGLMTPNSGVITGVNWSITTAPLGGAILASGTAPIATSAYLGMTPNHAWSIYSDTISISPTLLSAGNYWLQLDHGTSTYGPVAWDVSYTGTSTAYQTTVGSVPSEVFQVRALSSAPAAPAPPLGACVAFGAVLLLQSIRRTKSGV